MYFGHLFFSVFPLNATQSHLRINIDFVSNSQEIKQQVILTRNLASFTFGLNTYRVLKTLSNIQNWTNEAKLWANDSSILI